MSEKKVTCQVHGPVVWEKHIACGECGNLFQFADLKAPRAAGHICACGHRLMPNRDRPELKFSMKVACPICWKTAVAKFDSAKAQQGEDSTSPLPGQWPSTGELPS